MMKPENIPFRAQQAKQAPLAVAEYKRAQRAVVERMLELRAMRLKREAEKVPSDTGEHTR